MTPEQQQLHQQNQQQQNPSLPEQQKQRQQMEPDRKQKHHKQQDRVQEKNHSANEEMQHELQQNQKQWQLLPNEPETAEKQQQQQQPKLQVQKEKRKEHGNQKQEKELQQKSNQRQHSDTLKADSVPQASNTVLSSVPDSPATVKASRRSSEDAAADGAKTRKDSDRRKRAPDSDSKAQLDGVYHVVPVTPVVTDPTNSAESDKKRERKEQRQQQEVGVDMSKGDALWQSQLELDDEDLISLSVVQTQARGAPPASDASLPIEVAANGNGPRTDAGADTVDAQSAALGGTLSDMLAANAGDSGDSSDGSGSIEDLVENVSRQYMYYAAGEAPAASEVPVGGASDDVLGGASVSTPEASAGEAPGSSSATAADESRELARDASIGEQPLSADVSLTVEMLRPTWSTRDDPQLMQQRQQQQQLLAEAPEPIYNKVYDTIDVEQQQQQVAPFVAHLPEPLRSGRRIIVCGQLNEATKRATLSLKNRTSGVGQTLDRCGEEEFQVHLEVRDDGSTELTCRQFNGKLWTGKQRAVTSEYAPNKTGCFSIEIHTTSTGFTVRFEDAVCVQPHTLPFSNFTHLILDGNSEYQSVDFPEELELPYSEEFPQSLDLISQILVKLQPYKSPPTAQVSFGFDHGAAMLCVLDLPKQTVSVGRTVPETGGFLCETKVDRVPELKSLRLITLRLEAFSVLIMLEGKPVVSYNLLNRKLYITSFFIDGNFMLKDVSWKEKRAAKATRLPSSFQVGSLIRVAGRLPDDHDGDERRRSVCCVSLVAVDSRQPDAASSPPSAVGFCLRCGPRQQPTLSYGGDSPDTGGRQLSLPTPNLLSPGQRFEVCILYRLNGFELTQLGDCPLMSASQLPLLPHQVEPQRLSHVLLSGGAIYYEVEFPEQLSLPYLNRFPVSLKESRFVTVEIACGGLMRQRPTTISFALCYGPGDSGLKPLVCEFNMAQGYVSVAWADSTGRLQDEETKKFDPRLTNEVEVVALQATDSEYILSCNETAVLKYRVRHDLNEIHYVMIDGDVCITSVKFEGRAASFGCCVN